MTRVLNFKSDYLPSRNPDKNRYGRYVYELGGMDAPGELFNVIPVKPGLVLSYSGHASLPYPSIDFEIGSAPVDFTFCLAGTSTHRYHRSPILNSRWTPYQRSLHPSLTRETATTVSSPSR